MQGPSQRGAWNGMVREGNHVASGQGSYGGPRACDRASKPQQAREHAGDTGAAGFTCGPCRRWVAEDRSSLAVSNIIARQRQAAPDRAHRQRPWLGQASQERQVTMTRPIQRPDQAQPTTTNSPIRSPIRPPRPTTAPGKPSSSVDPSHLPPRGEGPRR